MSRSTRSAESDTHVPPVLAVLAGEWFRVGLDKVGDFVGDDNLQEFPPIATGEFEVVADNIRPHLPPSVDTSREEHNARLG